MDRKLKMKWKWELKRNTNIPELKMEQIGKSTDEKNNKGEQSQLHMQMKKKELIVQ
jgi:hypothetical protein